MTAADSTAHAGDAESPAELVDVLVVDDDERFRERLVQAFRQRGLTSLGASGYDEANSISQTKRVVGAVVDLRMPGQHGLAVLRQLRKQVPDCAVVVLTGFGSIATAVEAMRLGARDYLTKPCDADRILAALLPEPAGVEESAEPAFETPSLARIEREHIERVLRECSGNVSKAARVLGIHRRTLQYKLAKFPVGR
ncbi:MAG TPA: response regulator [Polyangiaceae bacterium]|nr:response regulator [Polyangiaceae bacterium]